MHLDLARVDGVVPDCDLAIGKRPKDLIGLLLIFAECRFYNDKGKRESRKKSGILTSMRRIRQNMHAAKTNMSIAKKQEHAFLIPLTYVLSSCRDS
jgi:hypothetical protein